MTVFTAVNLLTLRRIAEHRGGKQEKLHDLAFISTIAALLHCSKLQADCLPPFLPSFSSGYMLERYEVSEGTLALIYLNGLVSLDYFLGGGCAVLVGLNRYWKSSKAGKPTRRLEEVGTSDR